jgi:DNA repair exonuclease SbcCD ATPase subunit
VKFNHVKFKNFLSFGDEIVTIPLRGMGISFVMGENKKDDGSNGSGKSAAIVDSIVYALFGQTTKKIKADSVVNNKTKKDCFVELSFNIGNDIYIIRRYRLHSEFSNNLFIEKNGSDLQESDSKRNTQKLLEDIIKMSFKSIILSIVLSSEKVANFAEVEKLERKKIVENLLMYDFISKYHMGSKKILRKEKPKLERLISRKKDKQEIVNTLAKNLLKYLESWEKKRNEKKEKIEDLESKNKEWKNLNLKEEKENRKLLRKKEEELNILSKKDGEIEDDIKDLKKTLKNKEQDIKEKEQKIEVYLENPEECPVCGNEIKDEKFNSFIKEKLDDVDKIKKEIDNIEKKINKLVISQKRREKRIEKKEEEIKEIKFLINLELNDEDVKDLNSKINNNNLEISLLKKQLEVDVEDDEYIIETQNKIDSVKDEIKLINTNIKEIEEDIKYYEWWKDALSNSPSSMKTFCINYILKSLNKYINYYLTFFGYDMSYQLDQELDDIIIKDGEETTFGHLSRGEKRSVEISLLFSLYEVVRLKMPDEINIIILDELLSNYLDDVRINGALKILQELEERGLDVFVIEHKNLIKDALMCRTINVIKDKKGFSSLYIEN